MSDNARITFFHSPHTRSSGTFALLEELGADYDLHLINMKRGEQRQPDYLAVNPMGKVPAIRHGEALITEQPAVMIYLADLYPQAGLAPAIGDPLRGPYLRWLVFYGSSFEPAVVDRAMQREPGKAAMSPYGTFEQVLATLEAQLAPGPWLLGERFTAADVLWGTALGWTTQFGLVPATRLIQGYVERVAAREAMQRAAARDAELAAQHEAEAEAAS
ncbi:glutathione S-transferase family protein [Oleiagrimonas sp. C23AA]|uniref:glutathione S-transferase family protein n=1 Tax=Oleiagrimonas sp. C23AA TaxID=2719047 RepID=UPI001420919C|nr:glutathione S-transferase family protein [Oleiagrimonas sp. C23AA]NII10645.1 glutathione S-transferase family protein [Oleiagrimonas sp. C23AA]